MTSVPVEQSPDGIWLEVVDVRLETVPGTKELIYRVLLKGDRENPKPVWWLADENGGIPCGDLYHTILNEMDRKRVVLARLTCKPGTDNNYLHCTAFRFQSAELGSR